MFLCQAGIQFSFQMVSPLKSDLRGHQTSGNSKSSHRPQGMGPFALGKVQQKGGHNAMASPAQIFIF
jgi:hypothetical protein